MNVKKPLVILAAGWAQGPRSLESLAAALSERAAVTATSTAGLGKETAGSYVQALDRLVLRAKGRPVVLVGWSMGALAALETALLRSLAVARLVLIAGTARLRCAADYPAGVPDAALEAMAQGVLADCEDALRRFYEQVFYPTVLAEPELRRWVRSSLELDRSCLTAGLEYLRKTDLRDALARASVPTLILHGRQDRIVPCEAGVYLNERLPDSRLRLFEDGGHALPVTHAREVAGLVLDFAAP